MSHNFAAVIDEVMQLSPEEKQELQDLLGKYLVEERRREIHGNHLASIAELNEGKLTFSSDKSTLRTLLAHD
jgi:hypothetical protein